MVHQPRISATPAMKTVRIQKGCVLAMRSINSTEVCRGSNLSANLFAQEHITGKPALNLSKRTAASLTKPSAKARYASSSPPVMTAGSSGCEHRHAMHAALKSGRDIRDELRIRLTHPAPDFPTDAPPMAWARRRRQSRVLAPRQVGGSIERASAPELDQLVGVAADGISPAWTQGSWTKMFQHGKWHGCDPSTGNQHTRP